MKRSLSFLVILMVSFGLAACGNSGTNEDSTMMENEAGSGVQDDLGPLTVQDCKEIGDLVDADTGYSCLIGVAIEQEDASICGEIPQSSSQYQECLNAMGK